MQPRARSGRSIRVAAALALLASLAACTPDFENVWQVLDLRILAIQAEPPEVLQPLGTLTFPAVKVSALVVDPRAPDGAVFDWKLWACTADENRCEISSKQVLVKEGRSTLDAIRVDYVLSTELYLAAIQADVLKGFGGVPVMLELQVSREGSTDRGVKRLVYGAPLPSQKTPNANPTLAGVLADDKPLPAALTATVGTPIKLLPEPAKEAAEQYWVATYTGGERQLTEFLSYAFFTTSGKLSDATTGGKPTPFVENKKIADPSSTWTPTTPGLARLWVVTRDDRGGVSWTTFTATVLPAAEAGAAAADGGARRE